MKKRLLLAFSLVLLGACGGGGGDDPGGFNGVWYLDLYYSGSDCGAWPEDIGLSERLELTFQVSQNGNQIVARNMETDVALSGSTVEGGDGFVTSNANMPVACVGGSATYFLSMWDRDGDDSQAGIEVDAVCPTRSPPGCRLFWDGHAYRG